MNAPLLRPVGGDDVASLEHGVVIHGHVLRGVSYLQEQAVPAPLAVVDILEEVVRDRDPRRRLALGSAVGPKNIDTTGGVPDDVAPEGDLFNGGPGCAPA